jgi:hypothetical protein
MKSNSSSQKSSLEILMMVSLSLLIILSLVFSIDAEARRKKKSKKSDVTNPRVEALRGEDKELFESLTKKQQKKIMAGEVETGYNEWMVRLALGEPFYGTEHHPIYVDYEQVWFYTKQDVDERLDENKIMDPQTNWPTIHRKKYKKTCTVGDFFLLFDRGVVEKITKDKSGKVHGSCTIETSEEFIPIVKK